MIHTPWIPRNGVSHGHCVRSVRTRRWYTRRGSGVTESIHFDNILRVSYLNGCILILRSWVVSSKQPKLGLTQEFSFSRISESTTGHTFTPFVGSFTSERHRQMWGERDCLSFETAVGGIKLPSPRLTVRRSTARPPLPTTRTWDVSDLANLTHSDYALGIYFNTYNINLA